MTNLESFFLFREQFLFRLPDRCCRCLISRPERKFRKRELVKSLRNLFTKTSETLYQAKRGQKTTKPNVDFVMKKHAMTFPFKGLITLCRLKLTGYLKDCVLM
jgi:hypothetical protein